MVDWNSRTYTVAEAAALAGLHRSALDNVISRASIFADMFSEKRGHRRWFSPRDITTLRLAYELERGGRHWSTAIAQAIEQLAAQPEAGAILMVPINSVSHRSGKVITEADIPATEQSMSLYPIGRIAGAVVNACQELKDS